MRPPAGRSRGRAATETGNCRSGAAAGAPAGQGVGGPVEPQLLAHRQHQLLQPALVHQGQGLGGVEAVALLPGGPLDHGGQAGGAPGTGAGWIAAAVCDRLQDPGGFPQLFGQAAGGGAAAQGTLQPQPAVAAVAAQLPARQHRLHARRGTGFALQGRIEEAEGQQQPRPGVARTGGDGPAALPRQPAEGGAGEAPGQLEAPRPAQLQAVGAATGGDAQPRRSVPEEAETAAALAPAGLAATVEVGQQAEGITAGQGDRQAEHAVLLELGGAPAGLLQQGREVAARLHQLGAGGCQAVPLR